MAHRGAEDTTNATSMIVIRATPSPIANRAVSNRRRRCLLGGGVIGGALRSGGPEGRGWLPPNKPIMSALHRDGDETPPPARWAAPRERRSMQVTPYPTPRCENAETPATTAVTTRCSLNSGS